VRLIMKKKNAAPSWIAVVGFLCTVFTFFGVNYLLPGCTVTVDTPRDCLAGGRSLFFRHDPYVDFPQLLFVHLVGALIHGTHRETVLGEGDDLLDGSFARHEHDQAVEAGAMPPWGGGPYLKASTRKPNLRWASSSEKPTILKILR
jgi:hypothetical protein